MNAALRNECDVNAAQLIPTSIISVYLFATTSNITIPVTHQANLAALIEPQDFPQAISVEAALCHDIFGKDRLKVQRAVAKYTRPMQRRPCTCLPVPDQSLRPCKMPMVFSTPNGTLTVAMPPMGHDSSLFVEIVSRTGIVE